MTPLYEIKELRQRFEKGPINLDVKELKIKRGGITGLVGPNGSGKSTLLKVLSFLIPYDGTILFDGEPVKGREAELRSRVSYLLQDPYLLKRSVYENVAYGLNLRGGSIDVPARVEESLRAVGLEPDKFAQRPWYRLSGGEVQRVALASRLALRPEVLFLDEPTANVDEESAQLVMDAAVRASRDGGTTVIIATHDLPWLYEMSTDLVSLYRGRVSGRGAENLLQGGWRRSGDMMLREFADGQALFAYPPKQGAPGAAMINSDDIQLSAEAPNARAEKNVLRGRVLQMTLERAENTILISAEVGDNLIKTRLRPEEARAMSLAPSSEVTLEIPWSAVRWL